MIHTDRSEPTTHAGKALLNDLAFRENYLWPGVQVAAILAIEAEARQPDSEALRLLRELSECVTALENRSIRSSGEFHVWFEERMVTEARDAADRYLAALPPSDPPA